MSNEDNMLKLIDGMIAIFKSTENQIYQIQRGHDKQKECIITAIASLSNEHAREVLTKTLCNCDKIEKDGEK